MTRLGEYELDLKESLKQITQIYDIIAAADGEILDGFHRIGELKELGIEPRIRKLTWCETEEQKLMVRTHLNLARRKISPKEKKKMINARAEQLFKKGVARGRISPQLILEGWPRRTVYRYLDKKYELERVPRGTGNKKKGSRLRSWNPPKKLECPYCGEIVRLEIKPPNQGGTRLLKTEALEEDWLE